jgi:putative transposase
VKRSLLVDGRGVPLAVVTAAANIPDPHLAPATLDAVVLRAGRGVRRPQRVCMDRGYDTPASWQAVRGRRIIPHIRKRRRRGAPPLLVGHHQGKPRRWVVERTGSWHNRYRGLLVRWERIGANYQALVELGSALIALQQARRF